MAATAIDDDDDGFDWAAAVAEIENVESSLLRSRAGGNAGGHCRQRTIESFFNNAPAVGARNQRELQEARTECEVSNGAGIAIDPVAAQTWIYPANVPHRDYQFSIAKTALFENTLVSLPTGLGKTLIAAVVIYNFYRWFPEGKIVFAAPSRPLVVQQIEACHNNVGISQDLTTDMTGQVSPSQRAELWQTKRVFFVTPQVLEKDIHSGICPMKQLVCLVVDEAHRALGNYSYCVVVRELLAAKVALRILALTATPGSKQATIQAVVDNLSISHLEYRDEDDPDVSQYTHSRKLELIPVALNAELSNLKDLLIDILQPLVVKLCNFRVFHSKDILRLTPYELLTAREKFRQAPPSTLTQMQCSEIETAFGVTITLSHIFKLLFSHGIRPALEMLQSKLQNGLLAKMMGRNDKLHQVKLLMQQSLSHGAPSPKLVKMEEIVMEHFGSCDAGSTRVIIFTNYRDSVKDIMETLAKLNSSVKAMEFIGQSSGKSSKGQSQKMQQEVLQKFRSGGYNTIVATSIGEEGLDIMEVDLVVCFDANISPLRMIQRMGRTGRKRDGRVVVLASEGAEIQGYLNKQAKAKAIGKHMRSGGVGSFNFHSSPRMVPFTFRPEAQVIELTIEQFVPRGRKTRTETQATSDPASASLTEDEIATLGKYFNGSAEESWKPSLIAFPQCQLVPMPVYRVKHSSRTCLLISILQGLRGLPVNETELHETSEFRQHENSEFQQEPPLLLEDVGSASEGFYVSSPDAAALSPRFQEVSGHMEATSPAENLQHRPPIDSTHEHEEISDRREPALHDYAALSTDLTYKCIFSSDIVSVSSSGCVLISSPPARKNQIAQCTRQEQAPSITSVHTAQAPDISVEKAAEAGDDDGSPLIFRRVNTNTALDQVEVVPNSPLADLPERQTPNVPEAAEPTDSDQIFLRGRRALPRCVYPAGSEPLLSPLCARTPEQQGVSSQNWRCTNSQLPSVLRSLKPLKRLRRGRGRQTSPTSTKKSKAGKVERMEMARQFFDEEAEVSVDEDASSDRDEDEGSDSEGFIDDNVVRNTQASGDPSPDMMAVYRKSLLTQTPEGLAPWMRFLPPSCTPGSSSVGTSSAENASLASSVAALDSSLKSVSITRGETRQEAGLEPSSTDAVRTLELRKRKLSFQPGSNSQEPLAALTDDGFFDGLDLDALEAEAHQKAAESRTNRGNASEQQGDGNFVFSPSFDLGI